MFVERNRDRRPAANHAFQQRHAFVAAQADSPGSKPRYPAASARSRRALTLVELLIVIAIIGLLMQLGIPAVRAARDAARRTRCENNLRQLGLAALNHERSVGQLPTGGWSYRWVGDPDRGFDRHQPGGWIFSLLKMARAIRTCLERST